MKLAEFILQKNIYNNVEADSKKNLFKKISKILLSNNFSENNTINEKLNERERLGSTGVGNGVAIPHAKIETLKSTKVIFLKLIKPIDFSSPDKKGVDIIFSIIAPQNSSPDLRYIVFNIKIFKKKDALITLRKLNDKRKIYDFLSKF